GIATGGATPYVTHSPCLDCASVVQAAGIVRVVYDQTYGPPTGVLWLMNAGVKVQRFSIGKEDACARSSTTRGARGTPSPPPRSGPCWPGRALRGRGLRSTARLWSSSPPGTTTGRTSGSSP